MFNIEKKKKQAKETVMHWLLGCTRQAATEYPKRHNNVLMILCLALEIHKGLLGKKIRNCTKKGGKREEL